MMQRTSTDNAREHEAAAQAAEMLRAGSVIVLPTETTPALAAAADNQDAVEALWRIKSAEREPLALHVPASRLAALVEAPATSSLQRRLIDRFVPGPIELHVPLAALPEPLTPERLGVSDDCITMNDCVMLRAPGHPFAQAVLEATGDRPIIMASASIKDATPPRTVALAADRFEMLDASRQPEHAFDFAPESLGRPSTAVRFESDGSLVVLREGAIEERYMRSRLPFVVLFVCTGNTCRSPMAESIARALASDRGPGDVPLVIRSAGTSAADGAPATAEAIEAVAAMGLDLTLHRSSALTRAALEEADAVFAMTSSHAAMAAQIHPMLASAPSSKIMLLDPSGADIPDPIGMSQQVYIETAERLRTLIAERFEQIAPSAAPSAAQSGTESGAQAE